MSVRLPDHLDLIACAPDGIKKLRGLILELAVRGKLVKQVPDDEPASELLKRIAKERVLLEADGVCRKSKATSAFGADDEIFSLPTNWEWSRLGVISEKLTDGSHNPPRDAESGIPMLSSQNVQDGWIDTSNPSRYLSEQDFVLEDARTKISQGDVLLTIVASIGRSAVVKSEHRKFALQRSVAVIQSKLLSDFLSLQLRAPPARRYYDKHGKGTAQKGIYLGKLGDMPIAVPPISEQDRIVAKVDELMALCDRLEAEQADSGAAHARLVETLLGALTQSADADELAANWLLLAAHLDTLFATDASLDALKQTILQLAVMGKLVPQDPNDEPAYQTFSGLKPIAAMQGNSANAGPAQWALYTYRSLTSLVTSGSRGWKDYYADSGAIFIRTQNIKTDRLVLDDVAYVNLPKSAEGMRSQVLQDDILITITGANVTKAARVEYQIPEAYISQHIALTRPRWPAISRWLHLCFISHGSARGTLEQLAYGAKPGLNLNNIRDLELPIPPLAEQHRIVAKVDEMMALCDRLKANLAESRGLEEQLAATLIESALAA